MIETPPPGVLAPSWGAGGACCWYFSRLGGSSYAGSSLWTNGVLASCRRRRGSCYTFLRSDPVARCRGDHGGGKCRRVVCVAKKLQRQLRGWHGPAMPRHTPPFRYAPALLSFSFLRCLLPVGSRILPGFCLASYRGVGVGCEAPNLRSISPNFPGWSSVTFF